MPAPRTRTIQRRRTRGGRDRSGTTVLEARQLSAQISINNARKRQPGSERGLRMPGSENRHKNYPR